jgi:hypothetical protein
VKTSDPVAPETGGEFRCPRTSRGMPSVPFLLTGLTAAGGLGFAALFGSPAEWAVGVMGSLTAAMALAESRRIRLRRHQASDSARSPSS